MTSIYFIMMSNTAFGKSMEKVRKRRDINLETADARRIYLVSKSNCQTTKVFLDKLLAREIKRTCILSIKWSFTSIIIRNK